MCESARKHEITGSAYALLVRYTLYNTHCDQTWEASYYSVRHLCVAIHKNKMADFNVSLNSAHQPFRHSDDVYLDLGAR